MAYDLSHDDTKTGQILLMLPDFSHLDDAE